MSDLLSIHNISKQYDGAPLLREISFAVAAGEIVCLLGPSGAGKTTLLRIIAGLEAVAAGRVFFDGIDLKNVPPHERGFGMMFQDLALFPHKNVFENVAFGLQMQNMGDAEIKTRVNEMLVLVGLDAARFATRDVNQLSGGEQQRVALARALAPRPRLVMFDEPLGALDRILREELVGELRALLKHLNMTALYVTHDQDEAFAVADRLALLNAGRIEQMGTPLEIYQQPANVFVARFMGLTNLLEVRSWKPVPSAVEGLEVGAGRDVSVKRLLSATANDRAETDAGIFFTTRERATRDARFVLVRPRAIERIAEKSDRVENVLRGKIVGTQWRGGHSQIVVGTRGGEFRFEWDEPLAIGQEIILELKQTEIDFLREH